MPQKEKHQAKKSRANMSIGTLAKTAGAKVQTIRYYEEIGIMPRPDRTHSNRRTYTQEAVKRLRFIRHARELGFSIPAIRAMIELQSLSGGPCARVDEIAGQQLDVVRAKITRLKALENELTRMLNCCDGSDIATCRVIEVLSDHSLCESEHGSPENINMVSEKTLFPRN